jgi:hypothetical protein
MRIAGAPGGRGTPAAVGNSGDILTRKAFENAITVTIALAGSTNAVLHLLAIAHEAGEAFPKTSIASASACRCWQMCAPVAGT